MRGRFGTSILPTDQIELAKAFGHFDIKRQLEATKCSLERISVF